jgi:hypothetical protein
MKYPKIDSVWKLAHRCAACPNHDPVMQDLLYCGIMFFRETTKAACGHRPQSSNRIALKLIAERSKRLRLYQRMGKPRMPDILPTLSRHHRNHV